MSFASQPRSFETLWPRLNSGCLVILCHRMFFRFIVQTGTRLGAWSYSAILRTSLRDAYDISSTLSSKLIAIDAKCLLYDLTWEQGVVPLPTGMGSGKGMSPSQKIVLPFYQNAALWCIVIRCGTTFKYTTRAVYIGVNIESARNFFQPMFHPD